MSITPENIGDYINGLKATKVKEYEDVLKPKEPETAEGFSGIPEDEEPKNGFTGIPDDDEKTEPDPETSEEQKEEPKSGAFDNESNAHFIMEMWDFGASQWLGYVSKQDPEQWKLQSSGFVSMRDKLQLVLNEQGMDVQLSPTVQLLLVAGIIYIPMYRKASKIGKSVKSGEKPTQKPGDSYKNRTGPASEPKPPPIKKEKVEHYVANGEEAIPVSEPTPEEPRIFDLPKKEKPKPPAEEYPELDTIGIPHEYSWRAKNKENPVPLKSILKRLKKETKKCSVCRTNPVDKKYQNKENAVCSQSCNAIKMRSNIKR